MMTSFTTSINVEKIHTENQVLFLGAIDSADFANAIKLYNRKSLASRISTIFGLREGGYPDLVFRLLKEPGSETVAESIKKYLPTFA